MDQLMLFNNLPKQTETGNKTPSEILEDNAYYGLKYFYDPFQAADILKMSYVVILKLVNQCKMDCLKIRGTYRIPWWAMLEYLADKERIRDIERHYYHLMHTQETAWARQQGIE